MKKQWLCWTLAAAGAGSAWADVEVAAGVKLYGVLDQAVQQQELIDPTSTAASSKYVGMFAAGATSRLGVKGTRELSGGSKAYIQVELELKPDTPKGGVINASANRGTFVGLDSAMGTVRLGTQETMAYETFAMDANGRTEYKPQLWRLTQTQGDSASQGDRAGNSVKYITPEFQGFTGHFLFALGEGNKRYQSLAVKYQQDKFKAVLVRDITENVEAKMCVPGLNCTDGVAKDTYTAMNKTASPLKWGGSATDKLFRNIAAASYDFGYATANYIYAQAYTVGNAGSLTTNTLGLRIPLDSLTLAVSYGMGTLDSYYSTGDYAKDANLTDTTLGAYYAFDKSTTAYFVGSITSIGKQGSSTSNGQMGYVNTANIGLQYKF